MRKFILLLLLPIIYSCSGSEYVTYQKEVQASVAERIKKAPTPVPPNGVWIDGNLFADKSEIANINWLEHLHYMLQDSGSKAYTEQLPDTLSWLQMYPAMLADTAALVLSENYLRFEGYRYLPVIGISYEQAQRFCRWRSDFVTANYQAKHPEDSSLRFEYRLPTEEEWEKAAAGGLDTEKYPFGHKMLYRKPNFSANLDKLIEDLNLKTDKPTLRKEVKEYNKTGQKPLFNLRDSLNIPSFIQLDFQRLFLYTIWVFDEPANFYGLHHSIGNVAEMTAEKGLAKGGSWLHVKELSGIKQKILYREPSPWLGFRCVCEVVRKD